jgi:type I restriction enzyme, S subunit
MTARLPDHLDLIATAPGGIQKLRGLILELAVRGKLVPQDAEDESNVTSLGAIGKWAVGSGFPIAEQGKTELEILFAKVSDMNLPENSRFITVTNNSVSRETVKLLRVNVHPAGTVIFPKIGGAIATNKRRILIRDTAIDNNCLGITPRAGVSSEWLYVLLTSIDFAKYQAGTSVPALAQGVLAEIPVLLPSEAEQHRIVAKVDELMALCDRLEAEQADADAAHARIIETLLGTLTQSADADELAANWQRLAEHFDSLFVTDAGIDALKQTVLQLAVTGKLVQQNADEEPASSWLIPTASPIKKGKQQPLLLSDAERAKACPFGWKQAAIEEFCDVQGGLQKTPHRRPVLHHFPYLRVANVQRNSINLDSLERFELTTAEVERWQLLKGDLLVVEGNGSETEIGRCAVWDGQMSPCVYQNHLIRVRPNDLSVVPFLQLYLNSPTGMATMKRLAITTSGLYNLSVGKIRGVSVLLPPLAEQHRIVTKVDELMALCDRLKADLVDARSRQARLADTLIDAALAAA